MCQNVLVTNGPDIYPYSKGSPTVPMGLSDNNLSMSLVRTSPKEQGGVSAKGTLMLK